MIAQAGGFVLTLIAAGIVMLTALYLLSFGVVAIALPQRASVFLLSLGTTARLHMVELLVRCVVGAGFVCYASHLQFGSGFRVFGWIIVVTTLALAALPWRLHQRFARASVPAALGYLPLIGAASLAAGAFVVWAFASGLAAPR